MSSSRTRVFAFMTLIKRQIHEPFVIFFTEDSKELLVFIPEYNMGYLNNCHQLILDLEKGV